MNSDDSHHDELPPELVATLRSLAGGRAPAELAARVEMVRAERPTAPPELWQRVSADLSFGRQRTRLIRLASGSRRLTLAAGILMLGGIVWLSWPAPSDNPAEPGGVLALAGQVSPERQRALRARLVVIEVAPERMSPTARAFSQYFGPPHSGPVQEEG